MPGRRKNPGKQAARALAASPVSGVRHTPGAPELLAAAAGALNALERAGIPVRLAHDAVITETGYVFRLDGEWAARSRRLAPFPVPPGDD